MAVSPRLDSQVGPPMSVSDIYANARGLSAYLKEQSAAIDEARRLPPEVVARVREAGMFRLAMPKDWSGPELSTIEQVEVIEELSKANASVGWCVMIGCDPRFVAGYLEDRVGRDLCPRLEWSQRETLLRWAAPTASTAVTRLADSGRSAPVSLTPMSPW
jgi:alkylation response protein AidB-like acyl-CoA dehydrogenase